MLKVGLLAEFDHEIATTRRLIERIPADRLGWRPHVKSMTLGGLAHHIASLPEWGLLILDRLQFDLSELPPRVEQPSSRDEILAQLSRTAAALRTALEKTDAELWAMWSLRRNDQEVFSMPRLSALRSFVLMHLAHHRGQLSVYLRLNDVAVPAIYGPTADEG
jgi:uncharacterized damage-inducible protein DinB